MISETMISETMISEKEFSRHAKRAQAAARSGPVVITDHGRPAHVLMSFEQYLALTAGGRTIADCLAMPETADVDLPLECSMDVARPAQF